MKIQNLKLKALGICALAAFVTSIPRASATVLTFDVFTDPGKTTFSSGAMSSVQTYGDAVTDFDPAGSFGGFYYSYGSTGGFTPDIDTSYGYTNYPSGGTGTGPAGSMSSGYGDLTRTVWASMPTSTPGPFFMEFRFTPTDIATKVYLLSFDWAAFGSAQVGQTLKIIQNIEGVTPIELWSAGADGTVTAPNVGHTTYTPDVSGTAGSTVSLIFGTDVEGTSNVFVGVSNITFSQVPEPTALALGALGLTVLMVRRRFSKR